MSANQSKLIRSAGRDVIKESSVAICGLARDCAANLESIIPQVEQLASAFNEHRIIVVENDSADETGPTLSHWNQKNNKVRLIRYCYKDTTEIVDANRTKRAGERGWFGEERMRRMAFSRNLYIEALHESPYPDYVIVIDLDIKSFSHAGIEHSFGQLDDWDIVAANGKRYSIHHPLRGSVYWDTYAYEPIEGFKNGIQTLDEIRAEQTKISAQLTSGKMLAVKSAFGGLCIYRAELLSSHKYSVLWNDDPEIRVLCDHPTLHRSIWEENSHLRFAINPLLIVRYASVLDQAKQALGLLIPTL